jgi:hypothetical protein
MSGNLVKYASYDLEEADKEQTELDAGAADFMKLKAGRNVVRILPPPLASGRRSPFVKIWQHFIELPGAAHPVSFSCPRLMLKKHCPACQKADQLKATGNPADLDMAKDLFAKRRVFANVINRAEPEKGPRILGFGKTIDEQLVALRRDEDAGGDYTDPVNGFDIIISRQGSTKNDTKYDVRPSRQSTPLATTQEQMQDWIDTQHSLEALNKVPTAEELAAMFTNTPSDRSGMVGGQRPRPVGQPAQTRGRRAQDDAVDTEGEEA